MVQIMLQSIVVAVLVLFVSANTAAVQRDNEVEVQTSSNSRLLQGELSERSEVIYQ